MDSILLRDNNKGNTTLALEDIFSSIEKATNFKVSIYSPLLGAYSLQKLPIVYQRHMSDFCRIIKANKTGIGCSGHDAQKMTRLAGEKGEPFVNLCHAGIAEVIIPVFGVNKSHIATIFIGPGVTDDVEVAGFQGIMKRVKELGVDEPKLKTVFNNLQRIDYKEFLSFGCLIDMAVKGIFKEKGVEAFEQEVMLAGNPAIKRAIDIIDKQEGAFYGLNETELAEKVFLNPAYFSRLFKKIMKRNFTEYITEKKMISAANLLETTDLSIMDIALACGYSRQSYFTRVFRNTTGVTPSQYRNTH
jgi:AraC-like DNA-binding protein/ligand-binding sensor protein